MDLLFVWLALVPLMPVVAYFIVRYGVKFKNTERFVAAVIDQRQLQRQGALAARVYLSLLSDIRSA